LGEQWGKYAEKTLVRTSLICCVCENPLFPKRGNKSVKPSLRVDSRGYEGGVYVLENTPGEEKYCTM
jgi:hypothetical protein